MTLKRNFFILVLALLALLPGIGQAQARENFRGVANTITRSMPIDQILASKESCIECHTKVTPMIVSQHQSSAHTKAGVSCQDCHGTDHRNMPIVTGKKVCGKCHAKETNDMMASKHYASWSNMWYNARYWNQSVAIRQQGCSRCHDISAGFNNLQDVRCDYCHNTHEFSVQEAKNPATCTTCHMGPDHPQAEAYAASAHGKQPNVSCITCHGSHNVSKNMGLGGVSNGSVLNTWLWAMDSAGKPKLKRPVITEAAFDKARAGNLAICNNCHTADFSQKWLAGADSIKQAVDQQLLQAQQIIEELNKEGLLYPDPKTRPASPTDGQKLVLGGNQLYADTSKAEAIYFQMYKFAAAQAWKSAYHQDFKRAGTQGLQEMNTLMGKLQDEAMTLRLLGPVHDTTEKVVTTPKRPNYLLYGILGLLAGIITALIFYFFRNKKGKIFTGLSILFLIVLVNVSFPKQALAWSQNPNDQKQCASCHKEQTDQLNKGKHKTLACLDCHQKGAGIDQVRKPETCGKCHTAPGGYELDTYLSSPHGVQYQIKGQGQWVPTCATCHMPQGIHNPLDKLADSKGQIKGMIGDVCLKCHTTDHLVKFKQDKQSLDQQADDMVQQLKKVGYDLIEKGYILPEKGSVTQVSKLKEQWGKTAQWKVVNLNKMDSEQQETAKKLIKELEVKTLEGINEDAPKMRAGSNHVNPDYAHWYGNAYLNLTLTDVRSTGKEIETLAQKTGYTPEGREAARQSRTIIAVILVTVIGGFALTTLILRKIKNHT